MKFRFDLGFENSQTSRAPDIVIFSYSSHVLIENEENLLWKGLKFTIPPKKLEYSDYLFPFELLYLDIHNLNIINKKKKVLKPRIKDYAFSSFKSYNENGAPLNLTPEEFAALRSLLENENLIIKKSDKGNSIAIIDESDYLKNVKYL